MSDRLPLTNIQFLRFAASFVALLFHSRPFLPESAVWAQNLMSVGFAGVDVFFVISGFILWYTTHQGQGPVAATFFLKRRLARIFTGYWPYLVLALLLLWIFEPASLAGKDLPGSIFLLPVTITALVVPVSWTLTHEFYFYLLFFALLCLPSQFRKKAVYVLIVLLVAVNVFGVLCLDFYTLAFYQKTSPWLWLLVSPYTFEFLAGILVCQLWLAGFHRYATLAAALGMCLIAAGGWCNYSLLNGQLGNGLLVVNRVLIYGSASALLVYAAVCAERRGLVLLPRFSQLFGGASYSLYLSHTLLLGLYVWLRPHIALDKGWSWFVLIALILLYSALHYIYIEKPFYRLAQRWLQAESNAVNYKSSLVQ